MPYGALALGILKTAARHGTLHGYGIARLIDQVAEVRWRESEIYTALLRLEQRGWLSSEWRSGNNRRHASIRYEDGVGSNAYRKRRTGHRTLSTAPAC